MSRKGRREERLISGDELLAARGVDLDADDDQLLSALLAAIGTHADSDLSIADWLGSIAREESARRLAEWDRSQPADKDLRRIIRASLFRLQQRGVAAAAAAREKPPAEPVRFVERVEPAGYLSPLDGGGHRLAWLTRPRPEGGLIVLSSIINDRTGMKQVTEHGVNKSGFKERLADLEEHGIPMAPAPARYVDWLMLEAYRRGVPRDEAAGGYPLLRAEFFPQPAEPVPLPLGEAAGPLSSDDQSALLERSAELWGEREFAGWTLPEEMVKVHQARFRDATESTIVINSQQMTERLRQIMDQAFEEIIEKEARGLYASRLGEMALWYYLAHRDEPARRCHALHLALAEPSRRLSGIPFLRMLAERPFLGLLPRDQIAPEAAGRPEDPSPLIVRP